MGHEVPVPGRRVRLKGIAHVFPQVAHDGHGPVPGVFRPVDHLHRQPVYPAVDALGQLDVALKYVLVALVPDRLAVDHRTAQRVRHFRQQGAQAIAVAPLHRARQEYLAGGVVVDGGGQVHPEFVHHPRNEQR